MEYFKVKAGIRNNLEWRAILKEEEDKKYRIIEKLNAKEELALGQPFKMHLIKIDEDKIVGDPFDLDLIYWTDDLMLRAFKPSGCPYVLISEKLMTILKKYEIHNHIYYPVHLVGSAKTKEYYLLQIFGKRMDHIDYMKSSYVLKKMRPREVVKQLDGLDFTDLEDFIKTRSLYLRNEKLILTFNKAVLTVDYDILWGLPNVLYINKIVKEDIENSLIKGVQIDPMYEHIYITKSEYEKLNF